MKGLSSIPQESDLLSAYNALLGEVTISQLAIYSQWSRFDPRLAELWVKWLGSNWKKINPMKLREAVAIQIWPAAVSVLLEFVIYSLPKEDHSIFHHWKSLIQIGIEKAHFEQYFIGLRSPGGKIMFDDARFSLQEYSKWGYLGRDVLLNKAGVQIAKTCSLDIKTRQEILIGLFEKQKRITVFDYWTAIGKSVSRRQAERDLAKFPNIEALNHTKGRYYVYRKKSL
jgi:hypothetical protein